MSREDAFPHFEELDPKVDSGMFKSFIQRAKRDNPMGAAVDVHKVGDYKKMRLFTTRDGLAGYAVNEHGELNSVFKHPNAPYENVAQRAAEHAQVLGGATHASAFDPALPSMYARGGMAPLSHVQWNEQYKPPRWKVSRQGRPDVVFMGATNTKIGAPASYTPLSTPEVPDYETGMAQAKEFGEKSRRRK